MHVPWGYTMEGLGIGYKTYTAQGNMGSGVLFCSRMATEARMVDLIATVCAPLCDVVDQRHGF